MYLSSLTGEQPDRLLPVLVEQENQNFLVNVATFTNKMYKSGMNEQRLLLNYIGSSDKIIHTFRKFYTGRFWVYEKQFQNLYFI